MTRLDIVIFGATGYTGKYAVEDMVKVTQKHPEITWGIAGRSKSKLDDLLQEVSSKTGKNIMNTKTIIADVTNYESVMDMCSEAKVIANCCGPYFKVGEPVIRAAIASKTHYVDVAAEPLFMELMQLKYDKKAKDAGVYIISACGFDSIPNDLGVLFLEENFRGILNSVESYLSVEVSEECSDDIKKRGMIHKTSWESCLYSMIYRKQLEEIRKRMYPDPLPPSKVLLQDRFIHMKDDRYCTKFTNPDESVVYRTQRHLYAVEQKRPVQFRYYQKCYTLYKAITIFIQFVVFNFFARFTVINKFLLKNYKWISSGLITDEGATDFVMDNMKLEIELHGEGWTGWDEEMPDMTMVAKVSAINPYRATVVAQNIAALTILKDSDKMPACGVLTPGVAFRNTDLIQRLNENDIVFEIIKKKHI